MMTFTFALRRVGSTAQLGRDAFMAGGFSLLDMRAESQKWAARLYVPGPEATGKECIARSETQNIGE